MEKNFDSVEIKVNKKKVEPVRIVALQETEAKNENEKPKKAFEFFGRKIKKDKNLEFEKEELAKNVKEGYSENRESGTAAKLCGYIIRACIYLLAFLMPLFFLPFSNEIFEFNKQYLLCGLIGFAFLIWMIKMIVFEKKIEIQKTSLNIPIIIFLAVMALSTIFSVDKISSILGYYGRFSGSLLEILCLVAMYFLIVNNFSFSATTSRLLNYFLASLFFVISIGFLSVFGILEKILPKEIISAIPILASRTFNTIGGSLEVLSIYLIMAIVLILGMLIVQKRRAFLKIPLLLAGIILLTIINFSNFDFIKQSENETIQQLSNLPREVILDKKTSFEITKEAINASPIFGSGLGTFSYDFSKFRPVGFNQSQYWAVRFDKAGSEILERLATTGILGFVVWIIIPIVFVIKLLGSFIVRKNKAVIPVFLAWSILFIFQFFYISNVALNFCFWMLMGVGMVIQSSDLLVNKKLKIKAES